MDKNIDPPNEEIIVPTDNTNLVGYCNICQKVVSEHKSLNGVIVHENENIPDGEVQSVKLEDFKIKNEQPKQENYPNLNRGNDVTKFKTEEERKNLLDNYLEHIRGGYPKEYFPDADPQTIRQYIEKYPREFDTELISKAEREGKHKLIKTFYAGALGKVDGFKEKSMMFIINNMTTWKVRTDVTSDDEKIDNRTVIMMPAKQPFTNKSDDSTVSES